MSDLIDRQALLKQIDIDSDGEPGYYGDTWKFIDTIKNMPNVHDLPKDTDTISRQAAIEALYHVDEYNGRSVEAIRKLPPAQPEIIRCKDCKYYNSEEKECLDLLGHGRRWEEYDFCSYAERKQNDTERC